ncbi:hypothetical protein BCAH1134_C0074 (plasmid) [Bacillus cereus AH1134]|nr:hypothetical protein BCAH1134_C0074 [Bacillus cereus AH1134]
MLVYLIPFIPTLYVLWLSCRSKFFSYFNFERASLSRLV